MKQVTIYSTGSCDTASRKGRYCVSLQYGAYVRYLTEEVTDTTANRCIILGLLAAVERLKEPCQVTLVTSTPIGVRKGERSKGPNGDLVKSLLQALALGGHECLEVGQQLVDRRVAFLRVLLQCPSNDPFENRRRL